MVCVYMCVCVCGGGREVSSFSIGNSSARRGVEDNVRETFLIRPAIANEMNNEIRLLGGGHIRTYILIQI